MNQIAPCSLPKIQEKRPKRKMSMISKMPDLLQTFANGSFDPDVDGKIFFCHTSDTPFFSYKP
ncbi:hypothetical protein [Chryseobacterium shigense]|uniref:hypothetical protein n=1 Tax=Chryseobacterium shigense TaxID=297244 RepID=UPI000F4D3763|nr:hypothetical protein [Chryseobacterium shigense]